LSSTWCSTLADNGTLAVVLPHGVLFRGAAEGHVRRYLIEERNVTDAVIDLPVNIFDKGKNQNNLNPVHIDKIIATVPLKRKRR